MNFADAHRVKIIRSQRKSISMTVNSDSIILVNAPNLTPKFIITKFINDHEEWIRKQFGRLEQRPSSLPKKYKNGELFLFLGIEREFTVGNYKHIGVQDKKLLFPEFLLFRAQKEITSWYKKEAEKLITFQVQEYAEKMRTSYSSIMFSDTKSQWGSCSPDNRLQFSWRLILTPILTVQYVIIHELAHTFQKNHSKNFWEIVERYSSSYKIQRRWLKKYGKCLII